MLVFWCRYDAKLTTPVRDVTKPDSKSVFHVVHSGTPQQENSTTLVTKQFWSATRTVSTARCILVLSLSKHMQSCTFVPAVDLAVPWLHNMCL